MVHARERVHTHPLRDRLLFEYTSREASPSDLARLLELPLNLVSYHTGVLLEHGFLTLVRTEERRGGTARVYRATTSPVIEDDEWAGLSPAGRRLLVRRVLAGVARESRAAAQAGGFDAVHAHLGRWPLELDEDGWRAVGETLRQLLADLDAVQAACDARDHEQRRRVNVVLMGLQVQRPAVPGS
jgi:DNA-binding transcriptional ArsR family regulator